VTGASGGIGLAVCDRLSKGGASLLLAARDGPKLESLCAQLPAIGSARHTWIRVDMTSDESIQQFADELATRNVVLDGAVLMPPQDSPTSDPLPSSTKWREILQNSFVGPLALLKVAIGAMKPDPTHDKRCKIVIVSGISSAQVLGNYASSNVIRCAWLAEAKTLAFALGEQGIHVNTLSLGGTLTPGYTASLGKRAANAGMSYEERLAEETANVPLRKYGTPAEVAGAVEGLLSAFSDHMSGLNLLHDGGFTRAY
jgi:3-oxoacyl-[acyl-carrier protein] reductase